VTPYYEEKDITIFCGDCLEIMKEIPDKSIDLVLTDPPYGIGFDRENLSMSCGMRVDGSQRVCNKWSNHRPKGYTTKEWDVVPPQKIFDEMFRVSKRQIIWGGNYFNLPITGGWLVWDKDVKMPSLSKCELAWTSFLGHIERKKYLWAGFLKQKPEQRYHPTQKPIDIINWCLELGGGKTILDPFLGSGTTAVACKELGRKCIGIEISEEYCKIAVNRIRNTQRSML
jgi:site-specific DNA-methyltransferase (adenine-specific)